MVGGGGREHALALEDRPEPARRASSICAPGNPGIAQRSRSSSRSRADEVEALARRGRAEQRIDLVVVGPEAPLVAGLADRLRARGRRGVRAARAPAAEIEGSKAFAKDVMRAAGIPTAALRRVPRRSSAAASPSPARAAGGWW